MRLLRAALLTSLVAAGSAYVRAETVPYDHMHLAAPDQAKAVEWYQRMFGGQPTREGKDRLLFGHTRFIWLKSATAQPSAGSTIDHIAFSVPDVDAKMKELAAAGVAVIPPVREMSGGMRLGVVEDPWGARIEVLQDRDRLGFHHVHLRAPDPQAALSWYQQRFGGERATLKGGVEGLKYGEMLVLVQKAETAPAASAGRALDHVGWASRTSTRRFRVSRGSRSCRIRRSCSWRPARSASRSSRTRTARRSRSCNAEGRTLNSESGQ